MTWFICQLGQSFICYKKDLKMGQTPAFFRLFLASFSFIFGLFSFIFGLLKHALLQFLQQINVKNVQISIQ